MHKPTQTKVAVIGGGGHASVVVSTLRAAGFNPIVVLDNTEELWGKEILGTPICGPIDQIDKHPEPAVIAVGDNEARMRVAKRFNRDWLTLIHPFSWVEPSAEIGPGTVICAGAIVQAEAIVGAHAIINTRASIGHNCEIGDFSHVASAAHLGGHTRLGTGSFMAIGSVARNKVSIGDWTTIGAGAAVVNDLPDRVTAKGVPARYE